MLRSVNSIDFPSLLFLRVLIFSRAKPGPVWREGEWGEWGMWDPPEILLQLPAEPPNLGQSDFYRQN